MLIIDWLEQINNKVNIVLSKSINQIERWNVEDQESKQYIYIYIYNRIISLNKNILNNKIWNHPLIKI